MSEIDPEDVFDDTTIAKNESFDTGIDIDINPRRMREINLGQSYKGKVVSRQQLDNEWNHDDDIDDEVDDDYDEDSDLDIDTNQLRTIPVFESSDDDTTKDTALMKEDEFDTLFEDQDENTAGIDPEFQRKKKNKHSIDRFNKDESFNEFSSMMNKQMDKAEELQKKEQEKQHLQVISDDKNQAQPQSFQLRKAKAVASQTKLYDKVATLRIHLQKVLVFSLNSYLRTSLFFFVFGCVIFSHFKSHKNCLDHGYIMSYFRILEITPMQILSTRNVSKHC